jgi:hypothetical protein
MQIALRFHDTNAESDDLVAVSLAGRLEGSLHIWLDFLQGFGLPLLLAFGLEGFGVAPIAIEAESRLEKDIVVLVESDRLLWRPGTIV